MQKFIIIYLNILDIDINKLLLKIILDELTILT